MKLLMLCIASCYCLSATGASAQVATDVRCTSCVGETDIANQAVTGAKIANGSVTGADIRPGAITSDLIKNQTITNSDLAPSLQDLLGSGIADITVARISASGASVVGATCPAGRIPVGASCECDNAHGARNLGVLFGCTVSGTGAAAGCFEEARSFNPTLPAPLAIVSAVCLGAKTVDGTPWVPTSAGLAVDTGATSAAQAAAQAKWMKEQQDSFEAVLARFRDQRAAYDRQASQPTK
jgi:hypothetical protein